MKYIFTLFFLLATITLKAALPNDGYYRVQNYVTERYAYITDNKGEINYHTTSADLKALQLWKNFELAISDPATIIYIKNIKENSAPTNKFDLLGQGCSVYSMMKMYVNLKEATNKDTRPLYCYATVSGVTRYLGDAETTAINKGGMSDQATGDYRLWNLHPIDQNDLTCFGIKSSVESQGTYWHPFFADFPFKLSEGMEAYTVAFIVEEEGVAVIKKIDGGIVPTSTPVLIKCVSNNVLENKLSIGVQGGKVADNKLKGVYFCNTSYTHNNVLPYDPSTMRILSTDKDGKLIFATNSSLKNVPRNEAYLPVPSSAPSELSILTLEEFQATSGIKDAYIDGNEPFDVYNLSGICVRRQVRSLDDLPAGIYIANGRKIRKN